MPSRGRSFTRYGKAKWRDWARCRSRAIMAASMRPPCSSCLRASILRAPAISTPFGDCGRTSRPPCSGSTPMAIATVTGLSNIAGNSAGGLFNQGWKDSGDAIFHADGELAEGPIALCEVQGYVYAAEHHGAQLARALGDQPMAT